jgi:squalene synthase HpnC
MHEAAVIGRARGENFPVASRVLPRRSRKHLLALYGYARLVDEVGDSPRGDRTPELAAKERLAALDEIEADLDRAYAGQARHPLLARLTPTLRACELPREPFVRLIEANRMDQRVSSYETWEQLAGYCELSANPVGELVLWIFGLATPERIARSDEICTGLQLAEHCQDVAEDLALGRMYLPGEDLARLGCGPEDFAVAHTSNQLKSVLAFEMGRAQKLLVQGGKLIGMMPGWRERLAVAAFVAGGKAALYAIERADFDVLAGPPTVTRRRRAFELCVTLWESRR